MRTGGGRAMLLLAWVALCLGAAIGGGCSKKEAADDTFADEPTKHNVDDSGLRALSSKPSAAGQDMPASGASSAAQSGTGIRDISDNPAFYTVEGHEPKTATSKDIDALYRPVMEKMFGGVKLVTEGEKPSPWGSQMTGEPLKYVVRRLLVDADGDALHSALHDIGMVRSPRIGMKPLHVRSTRQVIMSLSKTTNMQGYQFCVIVDLNTQCIWVCQFILDPDADRF